MKQITFSFLLLSILFFSCGKKDNSEITKIIHGTSFGECYGYCLTNTEYDASTYYFEKRSWFIDEAEYPSIACSETAIMWEDLSSSINFEEFQTLEEVIGCPDCADGGAEFIEIITDDGTYKVTYEYNTPPEMLESLLQVMSEIDGNLEEWPCD